MTPASTAEELAAEVEREQATRAFKVTFAPDVARVARMRLITRASLRRWAVAEPLAGDVVLSVSELVTNAIEHGSGRVALRVRFDAGELRVEVSDESAVPAKRREAAVDDISGRGLILVDALATSWGVRQQGRTTWCVFHVPVAGQGDHLCEVVTERTANT